MSIQKRRAASNRLRVLRADKRLSQTTLARRARLTQSRLSFIENGHIEPTPTERNRLARALKVDVLEVFPPLEEAVAS